MISAFQPGVICTLKSKRTFLAHLSQWLNMSYCNHWMSVVSCLSCMVSSQQLFQRTAPPKLPAGY